MYSSCVNIYLYISKINRVATLDILNKKSIEIQRNIQQFYY